jgi:hypothetical protein
MLDRTLSFSIGFQITQDFTAGIGILLTWILTTGVWDDTGEWLDEASWNDGI